MDLARVGARAAGTADDREVALNPAVTDVPALQDAAGPARAHS